jgi:hypothetical protein
VLQQRRANHADLLTYSSDFGRRRSGAVTAANCKIDMERLGLEPLFFFTLFYQQLSFLEGNGRRREEFGSIFLLGRAKQLDRLFV